VVWFTRHIKRHQRNLGPSVEVRRARHNANQLTRISDRIDAAADASGDVIDGFGDTAFYFNETWVYRARVLVWVRTQRTDAARYFRERFGPSLRVIVESRRWDCGQVRW
jgi:hypothetical protein